MGPRRSETGEIKKPTISATSNPHKHLKLEFAFRVRPKDRQCQLVLDGQDGSWASEWKQWTFVSARVFRIKTKSRLQSKTHGLYNGGWDVYLCDLRRCWSSYSDTVAIDEVATSQSFHIATSLMSCWRTNA